MPHASLLTQRDVRGSVSDIDWLPGTQAWQRDRFVPAGLKQRQRAKVRVPESEIVIELEFEDDKEPVWLRPTAQALVDLLDLPENWDSYGARPVNPETVRFVLRFLSETMREDTPAPAVVPTSHGGVQLEWHTRGIDLEIEIQFPGHTHVSYEDHRSDNEWEAELTSDLTRLSDAILELSRRG